MDGGLTDVGMDMNEPFGVLLAHVRGKIIKEPYLVKMELARSGLNFFDMRRNRTMILRDSSK